MYDLALPMSFLASLEQLTHLMMLKSDISAPNLSMAVSVSNWTACSPVLTLAMVTEEAR